MNHVCLGEAADVLRRIPHGYADVVYVDPPFGTGEVQRSHGMSYVDPSAGYVEWLREHVCLLRDSLRPHGTMYLHLDWRSVHGAKLMMDQVFGPACFLNHVVWSYNYGGRGKRCWPKKHDDILVYARNAGHHLFDWEAIPRVPYVAPEMQRVGRTQEEAEARIARGQVPTDVWAMSVIGTSSKERTGYPTQKPVKLVERAILASAPSGGTVLDCFAGSGTTGAAALNTGRSFFLIDSNPQAVEVMRKRFAGADVAWQV